MIFSASFGRFSKSNTSQGEGEPAILIYIINYSPTFIYLLLPHNAQHGQNGST